MIRVLQNLPQRVFKSCHGGVYLANRSQPVAETQRRRYQDQIVTFSHPGPVFRARFHTSRRYESLGNHEERSEEEWRKSFKHRVEWDSFRRSSYCQEALGWGSIIILGLQLGRFISAGYPGEERRKTSDGPVACVVQALPCSHYFGHVSSTRRSILPEEETGKKRPRDSAFCSEASEESVAWDYEHLSDSHSSGVFRPTWTKSSPQASPTSKLSSHQESFSQSPSSGLSTSGSSTSESSGNSASSSLDDITTTFDQVTQQCWGQVNNIIGGHLMSEGEEEKAVHHFRLASEAGYSKGQYNLGMCYELGKGVLQDYAQSALNFGQAAQQKHPQAQYKLGTYHLEGKGNVRQCQKTAVTLITQAANAGVTQAQSYLGMYYMTSEKPDPDRAVMYLQGAAAKKDPEAQYHLGMCYEFGWGVEINQAKAAHLYHSAASKDHVPSLYALGLFHEQGLGGLPENPSQARELFMTASSLGYEKATEKLIEMDSQNRVLSHCTLSFNSNSSSSSDSLISWDRSFEPETERAELGRALANSFSSLSSDSNDSEVSSVVSSHWSDILGNVSRNIHSSRSAPELSPRQDPPQLGGNGDGAHDVNTILHSLSLNLIFPQLHPASAVKGHGDQSDKEWNLGWVSRGDGEKFSLNSLPSGSQGHNRVQFQLGGGGDEEDDGLDWCEPIDTIAQRRLVTFKKYTAVV